MCGVLQIFREISIVVFADLTDRWRHCNYALRVQITGVLL